MKKDFPLPGTDSNRKKYCIYNKKRELSKNKVKS
jgi:hypothetical protein